MLAHRQPGARLAVARQFGFQVVRAQLEEWLEPLAQAFATVGLQQDVAQAFVYRNRRIGGGVHAAGNPAVDLPQGNLVGHQQRCLQPGAAGLLDVVGRRLRRQPRAQHALPGQVHVTRVLEHRTGHHFPHAQPMQAVAFDQPFEGDG